VTAIVTAPRKFGWFETVRRIVRYRLHIPLKRSRHPPEHLARGVMVGVIWAMTPIFGLQMVSVLLTWIVARKLFNWDFSLVNGLAWTWTTNAFTIIPAFYMFWITGQVMLGRFDDLTGYQSFKDITAGWSADAHAGFIEATLHQFSALFDTVGVPMAIGCVPWAAALGWISYRLTLQFVIRYRRQRAERMAGPC
jgi:uncharacterized protein